MFIQLRRVVYLLVLLQCCVCVTYAEESSSNRVSEAEQFLKEWVNKSEGYLAEGKAYQEVWGTTVETCNSRANDARDVASGTKEIVTEIIIERAKMNPLRDHLLRLVKKATGEVKKNVSVLNGAADAVEEARYLDRISALAMMNMRDMLENQNESRKHHTEVLEGVDEDKRSVEQEALIKRSKRVHDEMNKVYHHLLVIKRRSHACAKEVSNGVIATKNRIIRACDLFWAVGSQFKIDSEEYRKEVDKFVEAIRESLGDEVVDADYNTAVEKRRLAIVGRTSASAFAGAAPPHKTTKRTIDKAKLTEKVAATKKNEKESLEREKREEERELRNLHEERQRERERKKANEEENKAAEERRKEQERNKAEEEKKKIKENEGKQELERKAKEEMEKKKKKDGSSCPTLVHSPILFFLLMCVLGFALVC
ncbi:uncharacterized protein TM35_000281910 [Trypanosoma theileri]|uniref:Uncharacterized protein n=1 Tax=Trypanosoma theileri TaxID=67003 RepID=A0A1X0NP51_9TRYP|nr:uncharacterized protein TM35_000281910 [Trypanosoma theileri]ORC86475.1 hypothetical protein TM35_000281910 [Trypanosoma theileri]